ncbi:hypothetical protein E4T56_gene7141 [Termitomyces sp. T112]|nr:hypothetical protein E4T56_gene7141 [Termitomyces sp. T112]
MSVFGCLAKILVCVFSFQGAVAANHGSLGNRNLHHRHHFAHHHHPTTSAATSDSTSSLAGLSTSPISRFVTSTRSTTFPTSLALRTEAADASESDNAIPADSPDTDVTAPDENDANTSNPSDPDSSTIDEIAQQTARNSRASLTPNGIKAGIAGGDAYPFFKDHIGWWYDWTPNPSKPGNPIGVPMLWGGGTADSVDAARLIAFKKITSPPPYVLAYEEPDCPPGSGSAGMTVSAGVSGWERLIVPLGKRGSLMGSPSMCKQADETWLAQFSSKISTQWDFTAVHINKNNIDGVKKDIEHYWNTYKKPIWVTEFACVNDKNGFVPCTNQDEINNYINAAVSYFESESRVYAYAYSNGLGLGNAWPLMRGNSLSESGKAYLAAVRRYH